MKTIAYKKNIAIDFSAAVVLIVTAAVMLRHTFFGAGTPDESFYLSIPYRVLSGDALVVDEWHVSQFSSFLQYLPMWVYYKIAGSTDGIILFFRILFVFCQTLTGAFVYLGFRRYNPSSAIVSMLLFLLYVPEGVMSVDYYTAGLMATEIITVLLLTAQKKDRLRFVAIGILTACAVVAEPVCAIVYFIYALTVLGYVIYRKKRNKASEYWFLTPRSLLWLTVGVVIVAICFLFYLFFRASPCDVISNLPNLFRLHEYKLPSASGGGTDMLRFDLLIKAYFNASPVIFTASIIASVSLFCDKKRIIHRLFWTAVFTVLLAGGYIELLARTDVNGLAPLFRTYPLFFYSLCCYALSKVKNRRLFAAWLTGLVYVLCIASVSLALEFIGGYGLIISDVAGIVLIVNYFGELREIASFVRNNKKPVDFAAGLMRYKRRLFVSVTAAVTGFCLLADFGIGFYLLRDGDIHAKLFGFDSQECDERITDGPLKGIIVSAEKKAQYDGVIADLDTLKIAADGSVFIAALLPWAYLYTDKDYGTFTCWFLMQDLNEYEEYFRQAGAPQFIYIPKQRFFWYDKIGISETAAQTLKYFKSILNCNVTASPHGYIIEVLQ